MFIRFLFLVLFLSSGVYFAQQKYFVYFKDKGTIPQNSLSKASSAAFSGVKYLSDKSIERRKRVMGEDSYLNYDDIPVNNSYSNELIKSGIQIDKTLNWFNAVSCYLNSEQYDKVKSFPFVDKIEPVRSLSVKQNAENGYDFYFSSSFRDFDAVSGFNYGNSYTQNNLSDVPKVHDAGFDGTGVLIGILDSGFELSSDALKNIKMIAQHDFVFNDDITSNQSNDVAGQHDHGTAVLSIMAGFDQGYLIGPAYNASFLLAKTENIASERNVEEDNYAAALEWMEARGVQITSSSLGYTTFDTGQTSYTYANMDGKTTIVTKAAELAFARGIITLTAAGNDGANSWHYISAPGDGTNIITVGAVTSSNIVADFSSRGPTYDGRIKPDICAQGVNVFHAYPLNSSFGAGNGTSYATPMAAGITALLLQAHPYLANVQVRNIILQAGDNIQTPDNNKGFGLLSAVRALNMPNFKKVNNIYQLNKMFIGVSGIISGSVKFNYSVNSVTQNSLDMVYDGVNRYTVSIPALNANDNVRFTISYNTSSGTTTEPSGDSYKFTYGGMSVFYQSYGGVVSNEKNNNEIPTQYNLSQNYPNPFNPTTMINYKIAKSGMVQIKVYDFIGREIATLVNEEKSAGSYKVSFNASHLASGIYFYQLRTGNYTEMKKMVLIK